MSIQFLVEVTQQNYRTKLVLLNVFTEILYTAFITDSRYVRVNIFHFIRAATDEYYVTVYHNDGSECNGYDLDLVGFRQRRCLLTAANLEESPIIPAHFFPNLVTNRVRVMVSDLLTSTVTMCRVLGSRLVFTNLLNNCISMIPFADSGLGLRFERVLRMPLNGLAPFVVSPIDKDPQMRHECGWDNHEEHHNDEKDCFYSLIVAYVTDRNRLVFHADRPDRRNHMNIIAPWRVIRDKCHFDANKMVRFKLIESVANSKQVPNNAKLQKDVIIIESSDDEVDIIGPHKRRRLNKYLNVVNNAYENTLVILEDESSGKNENQVTNNGNLKKEAIIIDSSDDEVDLVVHNKSYRFKKEFIFVKKNDVSIMPCDEESILPNIENQSSGKNPKEVTMNQNLEKTVIMNDISDYKVDIVYDESRTTNENLNKEETNTDFDDE
ncbi:hypothetical protein Tco_1000808 [Tanacetum coccineum]